MANEALFFREHLKTSGGVESFIKELMQRGQQNVHTPPDLCREIISELIKHSTIVGKKIAVLFNVEFLHVLINDFGVGVQNVVMFSDNDDVEESFCRLQYGMKPGINLFKIDIQESISKKKIITNYGECKVQFDIVLMNPPYQLPLNRKDETGREALGKAKPDKKGTSTRGKALWPRFVKMGLGIVKDDGYMGFIHPPRWRKPEDELFPILQGIDMKYLSFQTVKDGQKIFDAGTAFDWYIAQKTANSGKTVIRDINNNKHTLDISQWPFLPNYDFDKLKLLLASKSSDACSVLVNTWTYHINQSYMSLTQDETFKYPCVIAAKKDGIDLIYSSEKREFFGKSKVIFDESGRIDNVFIDMAGTYGLGSAAIGIEISSQQEAEHIKKALESDSFDLFLKSCLWHQFRIDWKIFKYFRKDFWKEFLPK